ncbi:MAG: hypothetical protein ACRD9R_04645 [Pyrinomonadaceae bacterium]
MQIVIAYAEEPCRLIPADSGEREGQPARIEEGFSVGYEGTSPARRHRRAAGRWRWREQSHALPLACLRRDEHTGRWLLARQFRPPRVK